MVKIIPAKHQLVGIVIVLMLALLVMLRSGWWHLMKIACSAIGAFVLYCLFHAVAVLLYIVYFILYVNIVIVVM